MEQVKSEKVFFNVFPTLKVGDELQMLFSDVEVKKITTNSGRDFLHIHIHEKARSQLNTNVFTGIPGFIEYHFYTFANDKREYTSPSHQLIRNYILSHY